MRHFNPHPRTILLTSVVLILAGSPMQAADQDQRIEASAKSSYNFKTYLKDDNVQVSSKEGVVTLSGSVSREHHKYLAQETVAGLPGVRRVDNQLTVLGDQPLENSDGWVTMKVKAVLAFHKNVSAAATGVTTEDGVVTLTGTAESDAQKHLTSEYAKDVEGVKEVRNRMTISQSAQRTLGEKVDDSSITAEVKATLLFHKSTHMLATKVVTRDGVVSLHGQAENGAERDLVTRLAEDINGVKHVNNHMTVK